MKTMLVLLLYLALGTLPFTAPFLCDALLRFWDWLHVKEEVSDAEEVNTTDSAR